ncbi:hypothetical protein PR202_gb13413 [Eleusine coracana subsp. coracana]|uniref:Uncharacterized protein n=1 Tax=Eleusine coracana subsp. coracana TaxID=191504 RepID=A0AAV5ESY5_ELECO|nr:hypothetical protein PR202_gb13413 [Eleusine coracana subsp. coracana]
MVPAFIPNPVHGPAHGPTCSCVVQEAMVEPRCSWLHHGSGRAHSKNTPLTPSSASPTKSHAQPPRPMPASSSVAEGLHRRASGACTNANPTEDTDTLAHQSSIVGPENPLVSGQFMEIRKWVSSHVLRIEQYSATKNLPWGNFFRSSTFAAAGHRWSIKYSASFKEYDNADWICVHLQLEETFAPEVKAQFTTTLLDAHGNLVTACYLPRTTYITTFVKGTSKGHNVIRRKDLDKSGYIVNDSFRIRFDITVFKEANRFESGSARKPFVVVPPSDIARHIADLHWSKEGTDIDLEVDGQTFPAHRSILAARSPIFRAQLLGPMKKDDAVCMWIEDIEARVFKAFLLLCLPRHPT